MKRGQGPEPSGPEPKKDIGKEGGKESEREGDRATEPGRIRTDHNARGG